MKNTDAIEMFTALGQETRLSAFRLLIEHGQSGLAAGTISETLGVNDSTLSRHLAQLERAGIVERQRDARHIIYRVNWNGVDSLLEFMVADCCKRDPSSCLTENCCA